ncbi:hypothetical protein B0T20DRAFT_397409 [Sordaria brevicollis]|uniref:Uncharacterized protein n=1 Tax=Sordaria brevicollis TaxID=83679 RepID=A0AAE0NWU0_SORBR|nr:hypothetical protein B0T20DRAFT_397409 [Sordaria brevicollis]
MDSPTLTPQAKREDACRCATAEPTGSHSGLAGSHSISRNLEEVFWKDGKAAWCIMIGYLGGMGSARNVWNGRVTLLTPESNGSTEQLAPESWFEVGGTDIAARLEEDEQNGRKKERWKIMASGKRSGESLLPDKSFESRNWKGGTAEQRMGFEAIMMLPTTRPSCRRSCISQLVSTGAVTAAKRPWCCHQCPGSAQEIKVSGECVQTECPMVMLFLRSGFPGSIIVSVVLC